MLGKKTGGRTKGTPNKATAALKEYAQQFDEEAIDFLVSVMRNTCAIAAVHKQEDQTVEALRGPSFGERVDAAKELLARGHGKPAQEVVAEVEHAGELVIRWADE